MTDEHAETTPAAPRPRSRRRRRRSLWSWQNLRDAALFIIGAIGVAHEELSSRPERPTLLLLYASMMGLPAFLRKDENRKDDSES